MEWTYICVWTLCIDTVSDIGIQPRDRTNPGSTIVCVTTNVNTACCRKNDNNALTNCTTGAVGEWYYPNIL